MLDNTFFEDFRQFVKRRIGYAMYKVGSIYYKAAITKVYTDGEGRVAVEFMAGEELTGDIKVTEVQLYNTSGLRWLSKTENIERRSTQESIWYRFTFKITEV